jgi:hypothetical protein
MEIETKLVAQGIKIPVEFITHTEGPRNLRDISDDFVQVSTLNLHDLLFSALEAQFESSSFWNFCSTWN